MKVNVIIIGGGGRAAQKPGRPSLIYKQPLTIGVNSETLIKLKDRSFFGGNFKKHPDCLHRPLCTEGFILSVGLGTVYIYMCVGVCVRRGAAEDHLFSVFPHLARQNSPLFQPL